jgi:RNA polymerase sigma-70 factor (ECF subfamily)
LSENVYELAGSVTIVADDLGLRKLVHRLRPEWKVLIELSYFEGYTQDEIAKLLSIPLGTVKTRLRAALKELHKLIKE